MKSPIADEKAFCEAGKKYNILMVPGSSFACPGYVRLAYCVSYDTITGQPERNIPGKVILTNLPGRGEKPGLYMVML